MTRPHDDLPRLRKVLCYVVRDGHLLVFRHRDHPEAGTQVPAGTLHDGEPPEIGALRETEEETGWRGFSVVRALGVYDYEFRDRFQGLDRHELHERHVFLLAAPADLPAEWTHLAQEGNGDFWFDFTWLPLTADLKLAGDQHTWLSKVTEGARG
jgi:8-oxo-dGTP pyrophosphatase MutT (NUDIX family)